MIQDKMNQKKKAMNSVIVLSIIFILLFTVPAHSSTGSLNRAITNFENVVDSGGKEDLQKRYAVLESEIADYFLSVQEQYFLDTRKNKNQQYSNKFLANAGLNNIPDYCWRVREVDGKPRQEDYDILESSPCSRYISDVYRQVYGMAVGEVNAWNWSRYVRRAGGTVIPIKDPLNFQHLLKPGDVIAFHSAASIYWFHEITHMAYYPGIATKGVNRGNHVILHAFSPRFNKNGKLTWSGRLVDPLKRRLEGDLLSVDGRDDDTGADEFVSEQELATFYYLPYYSLNRMLKDPESNKPLTLTKDGNLPKHIVDNARHRIYESVEVEIIDEKTGELIIETQLIPVDESYLESLPIVKGPPVQEEITFEGEFPSGADSLSTDTDTLSIIEPDTLSAAGADTSAAEDSLAVAAPDSAYVDDGLETETVMLKGKKYVILRYEPRLIIRPNRANAPYANPEFGEYESDTFILPSSVDSEGRRINENPSTLDELVDSVINDKENPVRFKDKEGKPGMLVKDLKDTEPDKYAQTRARIKDYIIKLNHLNALNPELSAATPYIIPRVIPDIPKTIIAESIGGRQMDESFRTDLLNFESLNGRPEMTFLVAAIRNQEAGADSTDKFLSARKAENVFSFLGQTTTEGEFQIDVKTAVNLYEEKAGKKYTKKEMKNMLKNREFSMKIALWQIDNIISKMREIHRLNNRHFEIRDNSAFIGVDWNAGEYTSHYAALQHIIRTVGRANGITTELRADGDIGEKTYSYLKELGFTKDEVAEFRKHKMGYYSSDKKEYYFSSVFETLMLDYGESYNEPVPLLYLPELLDRVDQLDDSHFFDNMIHGRFGTMFEQLKVHAKNTVKPGDAGNYGTRVESNFLELLDYYETYCAVNDC